RIILPYAVVLAVIGLVETLLTLNLIDEITDTDGRPNRESDALPDHGTSAHSTKAFSVRPHSG
ncbi:MAG TPA: hypothetical protein VK638_22610, partial [Edaphobacter sp.]|nr:hypothetical protein [Edaphobacter sp.]